VMMSERTTCGTSLLTSLHRSNDTDARRQALAALIDHTYLLLISRLVLTCISHSYFIKGVCVLCFIFLLCFRVFNAPFLRGSTKQEVRRPPYVHGHYVRRTWGERYIRQRGQALGKSRGSRTFSSASVSTPSLWIF
jgi:hypothetical protein